MRSRRLLVLLAAATRLGLAAAAASDVPSPLICEDSLDGAPPFNSADTPCLLGCGRPVAHATGSLLPGAVNVSDIPYCQLRCVRSDASSAQSSRAPACHETCESHNQATPENIGWCMYWCVAGYSSLVAETACVPSIEMVAGQVTTLSGGLVETYQGFTQDPAWASWYLTQTVISRSSMILPFATHSMQTTAPPSSAAPEIASVPASTAQRTSSHTTSETQTSDMRINGSPRMNGLLWAFLIQLVLVSISRFSEL